MMDQFSSMPNHMQERSMQHLRAAHKILAPLPYCELSGFAPPEPQHAQKHDFGLSPKALAFMHLALARPYISLDGRPPPSGFFSSRKTLELARFLKSYNPDEPRVPAGSGPTSGEWVGDGDGPDITDSGGNDGSRSGNRGRGVFEIPDPASLPLTPAQYEELVGPAVDAGEEAVGEAAQLSEDIATAIQNALNSSNTGTQLEGQVAQPQPSRD